VLVASLRKFKYKIKKNEPVSKPELCCNIGWSLYRENRIRQRNLDLLSACGALYVHISTNNNRLCQLIPRLLFHYQLSTPTT